MYKNEGWKYIEVSKNLGLIDRHPSGLRAGASDLNNDGFINLITLDIAAEDHYRSKMNMKSMNPKEFKHILIMRSLSIYV